MNCKSHISVFNGSTKSSMCSLCALCLYPVALLKILPSACTQHTTYDNLICYTEP